MSGRPKHETVQTFGSGGKRSAVVLSAENLFAVRDGPPGGLHRPARHSHLPRESAVDPSSSDCLRTDVTLSKLVRSKNGLGPTKIRPDKRSVVIRSHPVYEIGSSLLDYGQRRSMRPGDPQRRGLAGFETRGRRPGSGVPAFPFSCVLHMVRSGRGVWTNGSRLLSRWMCGRVLPQHVHTSSHRHP